MILLISSPFSSLSLVMSIMGDLGQTEDSNNTINHIDVC